ncbi:MAG TPA: efflux RND transporter periplasmic adaptor subunit [Acidobacteria bacterium]|nr:efflux RND transporter periplasmic adaptor subunit [Acidobacteriota bacterium]
MRWVMLAAGLLVAGLLAVSYAPVRSVLQGAEEEALPELRASRSTLTESTVAIGTVKPKVGAEVKVGSQLSGVVAELKVNVGDRVAKGDVLASLRDEDWRARVDVLEAQLASSRAEREFAEGELSRAEQLAELLPKQQIEDKRRTLKVREADVERAQASLAEAQINLGYTVIRAPVSGTIASVSTYEGETVAASFAAPTFVTIVDLDRLEVQSFVDENDIGKVHVGQPVSFRVDAFPGRDLPGVVQAIYPKAQLVNNVVNYVVLIDISDRQGLLLRPEMTVHVSFILERRENIVNIPRNALLRERGRTFVVVKKGDGWEERDVETGLQTPQSVEILSGLTEGEILVADKQAWKKHLERKQ